MGVACEGSVVLILCPLTGRKREVVIYTLRRARKNIYTCLEHLELLEHTTPSGSSADAQPLAASGRGFVYLKASLRILEAYGVFFRGRVALPRTS